MLDNLIKSFRKEEKSAGRTIKKEERVVNNKIKPFEKDPRRYTIKERIAIVAAAMFLISLYTKFISLQHWLRIGFDMSSYPPESAIFWLAGSIFAFLYGYYLENRFLETIALIGLGFALIFTTGIINTYYLEWVWWT